MLGASDSKPFAKRDIILVKFDDLLRKLGAEELALNSLGKCLRNGRLRWRVGLTLSRRTAFVSLYLRHSEYEALGASSIFFG